MALFREFKAEWNPDRENPNASYVTVPGSVFDSLMQVNRNVQVGDFIVAVFEMMSYPLRYGEVTFNVADVEMPPGWGFIGSAVANSGGDPRKVQKLWLVFAATLTAEMITYVTNYYGPVATGWTFRFPNWKFDSLGQNLTTGHLFGDSYAWVFRGDQVGVSDIRTDAFLFESSTARGTTALTSGGGYAIHKLGGLGGRSWIDPHRGLTSPGGAFSGAWKAYTSWMSIVTGSGTNAALAVGVGNVVTPLRPLVSSPVSGQWRDFAGRGLTLEIDYRQGSAGPMLGYILNRTVAGQPGITYWNQDTASWQLDAYTNTWFSETITLPPGFMANGLQPTLQLSVVSTSGVASVPCDPVTLYGVPGPTATAAVVGATSGQVADMTPSLQVSGTPGTELAVIDGYRAWLYDNQSGGLLASVTADGTDRWDPGALLMDGQQARFEAQVRQTGGEYSPIVSTVVTVNVKTPAAPVIIAAQTFEPAMSLPGQRLSVSFPDNGFSWASGGVTVGVWRTSIEHPEPVQITTYVTQPGESTFTLYDYTAPTGQTVRYTALATATSPDGGALVGQYGHSNDSNQSDECGWLIDPSDPAAAVQVAIAEISGVKWGNRAAHDMLGRPDVLVSSAGPGLYRKGAMKLETETIEAYYRARRLLDSGATLLLRVVEQVDTAGESWHPDWWFTVAGEISEYEPVAGTAERGFGFDFAEKSVAQVTI